MLAGCSGGSTRTDLAQVTGIITHEGKPYDGAKVTFHSTVESSGKRDSFSALTDSSGKYLIAMVGKEPGIPPGMYKVTITKYDTKGDLPDDFDAGQIEAAGMAQGKGAMKEYENFATTKFSATLDSGKNEDVNFDIKGK